ncbi:menaquinone biosynthesis protein [Brevibacillus laterosporus]|uniref:Chorismate dehydratase n=1 Tax=Brevibacillus laterosporus TaxID=1465 RepID=A0AAP3DHW2_BRELA|nr:menaquinone biosynthesis protein [Brevibacillus laterosporus]MCR8981278.1 menaquinone biosynthesis protein [Brevibacillus laterosporus]MCZ0808433.1 menaquinone biosynthesis protein [Brevibacillus laterosporus]MCZ0826850.1 menaquinone biosynthesis protein [Brevibacillus laterosporus]
MSKTQLQVGQILYTNTLPVYFYVNLDRFLGKADFIQQYPAQLNRAMAEGIIDVGPISSFSYAEHVDEYVLMPDVCVGAKGPVGSIFLFSKRPIDQLDRAHIALTNTSATSVNLLRVILEKFKGMTPEYTTMRPDIKVMMQEYDASLLIGDEAILARQQDLGYYVYDLGQLWYEHTGYPMTFAVWAIRREAVETHAKLLHQLHEEFVHSKNKSHADCSEIVQYAHKHFGGDVTFWEGYFTGLIHDFTQEQIIGLEHYYACTADLGLLPKTVKVAFWATDNITTMSTS